VAHCLLPLLAVPLTFLLIPNKLMTDSVLEEDESGGWGGEYDDERGESDDEEEEMVLPDLNRHNDDVLASVSS
jgi:hypothetical protein